jgi:hypothetical protein
MRPVRGELVSLGIARGEQASGLVRRPNHWKGNAMKTATKTSKKSVRELKKLRTEKRAAKAGEHHHCCHRTCCHCFRF